MIRLVLLTDGTGQDGNGQLTNVARINDYLAEGANDQYCRYSPGVGTRIGEEIEGGMLGLHVYRVINEHYAWLSRCLHSLKIANADEFEVELFGFSRGAFISRIIAELLSRCGVPRDSADAARVVKMYEDGAWDAFGRFRAEKPNGFLKVNIGFLGCWDTVVTALGFDESVCENVPRNVTNAAHAVAINESRPKFNYTKMNLRDGICEEFFAGCHSDVGGGYDDNPILSRVALNWMIEKAQAAGVCFVSLPQPVTIAEYLEAKPHSEHKSISNAYGKLGFYQRNIDRTRINSSVAMLPWTPFADDGSPLNSEQMMARVDAYRDNVRRDGTMIA